METSIKAPSRKEARTPLSPLHRRGLTGFRTGIAAAACTAALMLSSCSADEAESAETTETTAQASAASPSVSAEESELAEPLAPEIEVDGISSSGRKVLSEQGTGSGTYPVTGGLEAGQVLSLSASCLPGESVTVRRGMTSYEVACDNPGSSMFFEAPASEAVSDLEITVETAGGSPFWLAGWVHDAQ